MCSQAAHAQTHRPARPSRSPLRLPWLRMHDFAALLALLLAASLSACAAKQSVAPAPAMSVAPEPGMSGGEQRALEAAVEFTPTAIHGAFHNNTESDLEIRTSVRIVGDDWKDAVPPIAGPIVPVRAGASSSPWSIALPPLRDGYHEIMLQTVPTHGGPVEADVNGYFRVERGVTTVIDFGEWYNATGGSPIAPSP
ncbi:hypothetical protein OV090_37815 [Nannocystis sp. RBIL2]|uniref:hypothetical protein n=1 Tax=Nannocystis sp. RBIL2 TaxID=2996788 RepID=UPI00226E3F93|nr:hypothetical protein [Nannocystis sp. RBIL2]MCY1070560.1 hypothetical protein [Nannocystis sp. RBIL2]